MTLSKEHLTERLKDIRLLSLDVDGVMTDGGLYYTDDGQQMRKFNVKDGVGIKAVMAAGVKLCIITASATDVISKRAADLGVKHVFPAVEDKLTTLQGLCDELGIDLGEVAHMGDDSNDLVVLDAVGLALTVSDAVDEVLDIADYVTDKPGGRGAVREIADLVVASRN
ncbi:MAG: KdsC family phosphatase [Alphaproteobacteria bacterium]